MRVEQVMSHPVLSVEPECQVGRALNLMLESGYRRLPVVNPARRLIGLLSRSMAAHHDAKGAVAEVMRREVIACSGDSPVEAAAALLQGHRVGCLPVVTGDELVGIVTRSDLLAALLAPVPSPEPLTEPAEEGPLAQAVRIGNWMRANDRFADGLGIRLEAVEPGYCRASLTVTRGLLNAVGTTHGGATFALADFAFAVASNSRGQTTVGLSTSMNYPAASREGDELIAEAVEESRGGRTGVYTVRIATDAGALVGLFTGTVYGLKTPLSDFMAGEEG